MLYVYKRYDASLIINYTLNGPVRTRYQACYDIVHLVYSEMHQEHTEVQKTYLKIEQELEETENAYRVLTT